MIVSLLFTDIGKALNLEFGLNSVDLEKAFGRVELIYLWSALSDFCFNALIIDMVSKGSVQGC